MAYAGPSSPAIVAATATITGAAGSVFTATLVAAVPKATRAAAASILDPAAPNPMTFDPTNPLVVFIVQACIIVGLSRVLGFFLGKIRQPRVISEVVAGLLIGPSAFGRIPGFTANIFPPISLSYLNLVANIGLVLFLFLVGLEVDFSLFRRNVKASSSISAIGMIIPFILGAAVSFGIYDRFVDSSTVNFGTFLLFLGVANAITAFPVLARILTELEMLQNHVGVIVLSAGVGNDVVGWILLALAIALVNAASGIIVLYVILCSIGWILMLWFIFRPLLVIACRRTGSFGEKGPTQGIVCTVIFLVLISAWITDRIGIHAIFGGFIVGLIVPHEIRQGMVEKIEDLVTCLFLPLYFALSGLKTDLGLLSNGSIWGWTVCVILVAFLGKFVSCGLTAKVCGMDWRESGAVGSLMACKGLVELIVLNIGLSAGILNSEVFAMFVTMALVTTFATTPLTLLFYPMSYRLEKARLAKGEGNKTGSIGAPRAGGEHTPVSRFSIILERYEHLPAIFAFVKLIKGPLHVVGSNRPVPGASLDEKVDYSEAEGSSTGHGSTGGGFAPRVAALRLIELSERTSSLVQASESEENLKAADSLTQIFKSYSLGSGLLTTTSLSIIARDNFSNVVANHAEENSSEMILLPWNLAGAGMKGVDGVVAGLLPNPFESIFGGRGEGSNETAPEYASFVRNVFAQASCDVGLFLDRGLSAESTTPFSGRAKLFFAFHGGSDDRNSLDFIVQLVLANPGLEANVVRILPADGPTADDAKLSSTPSTASHEPSTSTSDAPVLLSQLTVHSAIGESRSGANDTIYPTTNRLTSDSEDNLSVDHWFGEQRERSDRETEGLKRIRFEVVETAQPLGMSIVRAKLASPSTSTCSNTTPLIIIVGRGRKDAQSHHAELTTLIKENLEVVKSGIAGSSEVRRCLGDLGTAYLVSGVGEAVLVLQSAVGASRGKDV